MKKFDKQLLIEVKGDKFCEYCGNKKQPIFTNMFDTSTGKKIFRYQCKTYQCKGNCYDSYNGHDTTSNKSIFTRLNPFREERCIRCNTIVYYPDY